MEHDWFEHSSSSLTRFALASGVQYKSILVNKEFAFSFHPGQAHVFSDQHLECNLSQIAEDLQCQKFFRKGGFEPTDPAVYWRQVLPNGLCLMNIWDVPLNRAALHSLSVITGRLHQSHVYLFIDLQADVPRLSDPPDIPKEQKQVGDEHLLMKHRSRLEYLVRSATVAKSIDEQRSNACTIIAVHDGKSETEVINNLCTNLQDALLREVQKMKVEKLIDQELLVLDYNSPNCSRLLKEHIEKSLCKTRSKDEFPPSWLFLLDTLKCLGDMFIEKAMLEKMAQECKVVGDDLEKMLARFTAIGSVIYIPDMQLLSDVVILQPQAFVEKLSNLYYTEQNEDPQLHNKYGILTTEAAHKIFRDTASTYLYVLRSANVSMSLPTNEVHDACHYKTSAQSVDYIPSIRVMQRKAGCDTSSLHLLVSHDFAPINTHVTVASCILDGLKGKDIQVSLMPVEEPNVTSFEIKCGEVIATLMLVYQSNMYEIRLQAPQGSCEFLEKVHLAISQACLLATWRRKQRFADIKISFVVICPSCHNPCCRCDASHIQCYLPVKDQCERCGSSPAPSSPFFEWKEAVENVRSN